MECSLPTPAMRLLLGKTRIFMPTFVKEFVGAIRQIAPRECRDGIDHSSDFELACLECFFHLLALCYIEAGRIPSFDSSPLIEQGFVTHEKPAIPAIRTDRTLLIFERYWLCERFPALLAQSFHILWVEKPGAKLIFLYVVGCDTVVIQRRLID